jgi:hypothetical protein
LLEVVVKKEGFARHKFIDAIAPKEEATASWCDLIISLTVTGLEMLEMLLLSLQQLPDL